MRHSIIISLFFISFSSLFAQNQPIDVDGFKKTLNLDELLQPIDIKSEILLVQAATADNKFMYVLNRKESPIIKAFRLSDGQYMGGFGSEGGGPGEYNMFFASSFNVRNNQIITQDQKYVRIHEVLETNDALEFKKVSEIRMPEEVGLLNQGFLISDNIYGGSIMFTEKDFVTFDLSKTPDQEIGDFGDYPNLYPEIPTTAYHHLYQGSSSYAQDGKSLLRYYTWMPLLRVFDLPSGEFLDIELKPNHQQIKNLKVDPRGKSIANGIEMVGYLGNGQLGKERLAVVYQEFNFKKVPWTDNGGNLERVPLTEGYLLLFNRKGELLVKFIMPEWFEKYIITPDDRMILFHPEIADQLFVLDLNQFN